MSASGSQHQSYVSDERDDSVPPHGRAGYPASTVGSVEEEGFDEVAARDEDRRHLDQVYLSRMAHPDRFSTFGYALPPGADSDDDEGGSSKGSADADQGKREQERFAALTDLEDSGRVYSRFLKKRFAGRFRKGHVANSGPRREDEVRQKFFALEGTTQVLELTTAAGIYDRIAAGEVLAERLVARTGIGKTRIFPGTLARETGRRVLVLEPSVSLASQAMKAASEMKGKVPIGNAWLSTQTAYVTGMTYDDFIGHFMTANGTSLMAKYDAVIMDEAHLPYADVYGAGRIFATKTDGKTSLLVFSATFDGEDMQSQTSQSAPKRLKESIVQLLRKDKIITGPTLRDRTMLIVPSDTIAAECQTLIDDAGLICYMLDSASSPADEALVIEQMSKPRSTTPRYVVVVEKYGTGSNIPAQAMFTDAAREEYVMDPDTRNVEAVIAPVTESQVKQHCGRVNRGLATGGVAYICEGYGAPITDRELLDSERIRAFLLLRAAGIKVLKSEVPEANIFPFGVTPFVARDILAIGLPPEVSVRYFAKDGRIPANFVRALQPFCEIGHHFYASKYEVPVLYDTWSDEKAGGYFSSEICESFELRVPYVAKTAELRAIMHAISASASGQLSLENWVPQLAESEGSGDEAAIVTPVKYKVARPRLIVDRRCPSPPPQRPEPWAYAAPLEGQTRVRSGMVIDPSNPTVESAFARLRDTDQEDIVTYPLSPTFRVFERGKERVQLLDRSAESVDVTTPKGTVIVTVRADVWRRLVEGEVLTEDEVVSLIRSVKANLEGFASSTAFDNWSNVWLGVTKSLGDHDNIKALMRRHLASAALALVNMLYARYTYSVSAVIQSSYRKASFWRRLVKGRSLEEQLMQEERKGHAEVLQSRNFFMRVYAIRRCVVYALTSFEELGLFAPQTVSMVQSNIGMRDPAGVGWKVIDRVADTSNGDVHAPKRLEYRKG